MVELPCGQCDGILELPDGEFGEYSCPHCDADFEYENWIGCYVCQTMIKLSSHYDGGQVQCSNCNSKFSVAGGDISVSDVLSRSGKDHSVSMSVWMLLSTIMPPFIFVILIANGISIEWSCGIVSLLCLGVVAFGFATKDIGAVSGMFVGFGVGGGVSASVAAIILVILAILWFVLQIFFGFLNSCGWAI